MTPKTVSKRVVTDRLGIVDDLLKEIRDYPFLTGPLSLQIAGTSGRLNHVCASQPRSAL